MKTLHISMFLIFSLTFSSILSQEVNAQTDSVQQTTLWTYTPPSFPSSLAISSDDSFIVVGTRHDDQSGSIFVLDNNGVVKWGHELSGFVRSVHVSPDNMFIEVRTVQVLNNGARDYGYNEWEANPAMYLFDNTGQLIYSNFGLLPNWRMISLSSDKSLVVSSTGNGILYSDKSGKALWGYNTKGNMTTVSVSPNGLFVSTCTGDDLLLLNKQGQLLWDSKINQTSICAALVSTDSGYVLAGDALSGETGRLYLFDKNGYQIWNHIDTYENQRQAITPDGQYESAIVGESQRGFGLDVSFNKMEYVVVPEFPFAIPILLIGITSLTVFYRMQFRK